MTKIYAKFTGTNKSMGYQKGKKYHLNMIILKTGQLEICVSDYGPQTQEQPCVYANLHSLLSNWQILG